MPHIITALLLLAAAALAQQQERVAIIQTVDDLDSISFSNLNFLTDRLRETAANVLPKPRYGVMTTESIVAFLGSEERAAKICSESSCLAELGRKVNADYVAQARLGRFGNDLSIKTELYNTKSGNLIGSFTGFSKDVYGLLAVIDEKAADLFKKMPEASDSLKVTPIISGVMDGLEKAKNYKPDIVEKNMPTLPAPAIETEKSSFKTSFWVGLGLEVVGATLIGIGVFEDSEMKVVYDDYSKARQAQSHYDGTWETVEQYKKKRNILYIIGGAVLASGIGVHIWF